MAEEKWVTSHGISGWQWAGLNNNHPLGRSEIGKSKMGYWQKRVRMILDTWCLAALEHKDGRKITMSVEEERKSRKGPMRDEICPLFTEVFGLMSVSHFALWSQRQNNICLGDQSIPGANQGSHAFTVNEWNLRQSRLRVSESQLLELMRPGHLFYNSHHPENTLPVIGSGAHLLQINRKPWEEVLNLDIPTSHQPKTSQNHKKQKGTTQGAHLGALWWPREVGWRLKRKGIYVV